MHLAKFDKDKIKLYLEDIRLFFNIHNHPEIKIIGQNLPKSLKNDIQKTTKNLLQDDYYENDFYNSYISKRENNRNGEISKNQGHENINFESIKKKIFLIF